MMESYFDAMKREAKEEAAREYWERFDRHMPVVTEDDLDENGSLRLSKKEDHGPQDNLEV